MSAINVKEAMGSMDFSTAKGRAEASGKAIDLGPTKEAITCDAKRRVSNYIDIAHNVKHMVESNHVGITSEELEDAYFVIELLERAARTAFESVIKNY